MAGELVLGAPESVLAVDGVGYTGSDRARCVVSLAGYAASDASPEQPRSHLRRASQSRRRRRFRNLAQRAPDCTLQLASHAQVRMTLSLRLVLRLAVAAEQLVLHRGNQLGGLHGATGQERLAERLRAVTETSQHVAELAPAQRVVVDVLSAHQRRPGGFRRVVSLCPLAVLVLVELVVEFLGPRLDALGFQQ